MALSAAAVWGSWICGLSVLSSVTSYFYVILFVTQILPRLWGGKSADVRMLFLIY